MTQIFVGFWEKLQFSDVAWQPVGTKCAVAYLLRTKINFGGENIPDASKKAETWKRCTPFRELTPGSNTFFGHAFWARRLERVWGEKRGNLLVWDSAAAVETTARTREREYLNVIRSRSSSVGDCFFQCSTFYVFRRRFARGDVGHTPGSSTLAGERSICGGVVNLRGKIKRKQWWFEV